MTRIGWLVMAVVGCGGGGGGGPVDGPIDSPAGNDTPAAAALVITPMTADFGVVAVGAQSQPPQDFTISNPGGSATTLDVSAGVEFTILATTCGTTLTSGASCTATVVAAPQTVGPKTGVLTALGNNIIVMATAQLTAQAVPNDTMGLTITPSGHDFGNLAVGQTSGLATFTVTNLGTAATAPVTVATTGTNPGDFQRPVDTCAGASLPVAGTCTISVAFAPTSVGQKLAAITATSGGTVTVTVDVAGNGI